MQNVGRGLAAGQDGQHLVRLCRAAGRLSRLFPLQAVLVRADGGTAPGEFCHYPGRGGDPRSGPLLWPRLARGDLVADRCSELLPAIVLCREREKCWRPDRRLEQATASVDFAASRPSWPCGPCGFGDIGIACAQAGARGVERGLAADHPEERRNWLSE
ncbi:hypothetical protein NDU88_007946 [Pleurodeles waltl]|uniref:Uncharacterized protein n=1 Tax=Pleurodeles waltl TaxID=8319 RepID=A0AAV7VVU5_PLEWA|nr:hypothetical protein NDU88_007946 [Pleurodeles waltl]